MGKKCEILCGNGFKDTGPRRIEYNSLMDKIYRYVNSDQRHHMLIGTSWSGRIVCMVGGLKLGLMKKDIKKPVVPQNNVEKEIQKLWILLSGSKKALRSFFQQDIEKSVGGSISIFGKCYWSCFLQRLVGDSKMMS
jgi:hypothetical protein